MSNPDDQQGLDDFVETEGKVWVAKTQLKSGAVRLPGAIMQNITHIAPAIAAFFFTQTLVGSAGGQAPLAYVIGLLIVIPLGVCLMQLAKKFPSAGGYYTYVSRTLGPVGGFLTGWVFVLYSPVCGLSVAGSLWVRSSRTNFHRGTMASPGSIGGTGRGDRHSPGNLGRLHRRVLLDQVDRGRRRRRVPDRARTGSDRPGQSRVRAGSQCCCSPTSFNPGGIATFSGVFPIAVVLTVQGLTGWEAAVPLAEETEIPAATCRARPWRRSPSSA